MSVSKIINFNVQKDNNADDIDLAEKENSDDAYEDGVNRLSIFNFRVDVVLKVLSLIFLFWVIGYNICHFYHIVEAQYHLSPIDRLDPLSIQTLIKYGLGYNSLLLLVLGYWFGKDGGFMRGLHQLRESLFKRRNKK